MSYQPPWQYWLNCSRHENDGAIALVLGETKTFSGWTSQIIGSKCHRRIGQCGGHHDIRRSDCRLPVCDWRKWQRTLSFTTSHDGARSRPRSASIGQLTANRLSIWYRNEWAQQCRSRLLSRVGHHSCQPRLHLTEFSAGGTNHVLRGANGHYRRQTALRRKNRGISHPRRLRTFL